MDVPLTCQICSNNPHKYTCPRCGMQTCSLACCLEHKHKFSCSGVREPVVYYRRNEYGAFAFQQDYHLLEEIDRRNAMREKQLFSLTRRSRKKMRGRAELVRMAKSAGIELRLSTVLLTRAAKNRSHIITGPDEKKSIMWSVEFNLIPVNSTHTVGANLARLKPLRLVLHDCAERTRIGTLWYDQLLKMDAEEQDALVTYAPPGSPPFGLVTSWARSKVNSIGDSTRLPTASDLYYFYVQVEKVEHRADNGSALVRKYDPVEVFSTNRLSHVLVTPHLIIHEMPAIWVSRVPLT